MSLTPRQYIIGSLDNGRAINLFVRIHDERLALIEALKEIRDEDWRGVRPQSSIIAEKALSQISPEM